MKCDCLQDKSKDPCSQKQCDWYIKNSKYYNCFKVMKYFIKRPYTLNEIAKMLGISHTKVKIIEAEAIKKLKQNQQDNEELKNLNNND